MGLSYRYSFFVCMCGDDDGEVDGEMELGFSGGLVDLGGAYFC